MRTDCFLDLQTTNHHIGSPDFHRFQVIGQKGTAVDDGHGPASPQNPVEFDGGRGGRRLVCWYRLKMAGLLATDFAEGILTSLSSSTCPASNCRGHAIFHPIQDLIEAITFFRFDEQVNLAARVMILQNAFFFPPLRFVNPSTNKPTSSQKPSSASRPNLALRSLGTFSPTQAWEYSWAQVSFNWASGIPVSRLILYRVLLLTVSGRMQPSRSGLSKPLPSGIKHGIHIYAINDRDIHIGRERRETGKQPVEVILDLTANLFDIVSLQHHRPGVAGAKVTPIRQLQRRCP